ncbi:MAG TPA: exodeoxyribonuclease VII large subunit [Gemmatimonadaceae bacterium]|jgi:exodeoxyribonuclease VII large subunit|nr:exodeoxyribonuclease VII large subunit [Gemmatimonadaceae bacterium]
MRGRIPFDASDLFGAPRTQPVRRAAPGMSRDTAISVSDLNNSVKELIEGTFPRFWVSGEVTDFKRHRNGHWYFCLRDSVTQVSCVVWYKNQRGMPASPDEGMKVLAVAEMQFYAAHGKIQLSITKLEAEGDGLYRKAMLATVERLRADGLMDEARKRPIPLFPRCLGVITSPSGAALHDIVSVATRRRPGIEIIVACSAVQGDSAPHELRNAIARIRRWKSVDVIIIGRGGGARDDLRAFNDESVARSIAQCEVPVIAAIGHEVDTTVCDLVADLRAATPSAAAERAVPSIDDLRATLSSRRASLISAVTHRTVAAQSDLKTTARDLRTSAQRIVQNRKASMGTVAGRLNALSPLATLERGYAVARRPDGETLTRASQFVENESFELLLHDGVVDSVVQKKRVDS